MNLAAMTPQSHLSSSGYCLANPGLEYLIYKAGTSGWKSYFAWLMRSFTLDIVAGTYSYEWYNPSLGEVAATGIVTVKGGNQSFAAPFGGDAVLYLKAQ
jgi:hypothetical protein